MYGLNENIQNEKDTRRKKGKLEQCLEANIPLRMNTGGFFEIAAGIKSILFSPHERTMEVIRGGQGAYAFLSL